MKKWYSEDADYIETKLVDLEDNPDIWQNNLIRAMLKIMFHILRWIKKQEEKKVPDCDGCFGASFGDCERCEKWKKHIQTK